MTFTVDSKGVVVPDDEWCQSTEEQPDEDVQAEVILVQESTDE